MKLSKMCSGRGFDSRPVHHKHVRYTHSIQRHQKRERAFDGPDLVSTGQGVAKWTAG